MPTFISDPPQIVYIVLAVALVITGAIAAQRQDRRAIVPFVIAALLMMVVFLIDRLVESQREESVRRAMAMSAAADAKNPAAFVDHLADTFEYRAGDGPPVTITRDAMKNHAVWSELRHRNAHVAVWDFSRDDVKEIDDNTIEIGFLAKGEAEGKQMPVYVRMTFKRQSDGQMKLTALRTFEAVNRKEPLAIPNFP